MPKFIDTRGNTKIAIGVCGRCGEKMAYSDLLQDGNSPGLMVCLADRDELDRYRLPARETENITLDNPRPDVSVATIGPAFTLYANDILGITTVSLPVPWRPDMPVLAGQTVTPLNENDPDVTLPQNWYLALISGTTGHTPPAFDVYFKAGQIIGNFVYLSNDTAMFYLLSDQGVMLVIDPDSTADGSVIWLCLGVYPN